VGKISIQLRRELFESGARYGNSEGFGDSKCQMFRYNLIHAKNVCTIASRDYSEDPTGNRHKENHDGIVSHCNEISRSGCPTQGSQIQSVIFHGLFFSGFGKGKPEFSSSDARVNFLDAHG
jgi:hypothetical protein